MLMKASDCLNHLWSEGLPSRSHSTDCILRQGARPLKGTLTYLLGFFGPIRTHMGPCGPVWAHMGPARALDEREKFRKNALDFLLSHISYKMHYVKTKCALFLNFSCSSRARAGPIWAHMDLKNSQKHKKSLLLNFSSSSRARAGPIWAHMGPHGPIWAPKIQNKCKRKSL